MIDQIEVSRLILKRQLEKLRCVVAEASRFQDALLVLRDKTFDLILIDAVLIEASSQSVITEIRALQSAGHGSQTALIAVGRSASATATVLQGVDAQLKSLCRRWNWRRWWTAGAARLIQMSSKKRYSVV
mgnify:CR=1 FL=1